MVGLCSLLSASVTALLWPSAPPAASIRHNTAWRHTPTVIQHVCSRLTSDVTCYSQLTLLSPRLATYTVSSTTSRQVAVEPSFHAGFLFHIRDRRDWGCRKQFVSRNIKHMKKNNNNKHPEGQQEVFQVIRLWAQSAVSSELNDVQTTFTFSLWHWTTLRHMKTVRVLQRQSSSCRSVSLSARLTGWKLSSETLHPSGGTCPADISLSACPNSLFLLKDMKQSVISDGKDKALYWVISPFNQSRIEPVSVNNKHYYN